MTTAEPATTRACPVATPSTGVTREKADDDVEAGHDAADDGHDDAADSVDDRHDALSDRAEDAFDLWVGELADWVGKTRGRRGRGGGEVRRGGLTQETTAPIFAMWWYVVFGGKRFVWMGILVEDVRKVDVDRELVCVCVDVDGTSNQQTMRWAGRYILTFSSPPRHRPNRFTHHKISPKHRPPVVPSRLHCSKRYTPRRRLSMTSQRPR